VASRKDQLHSYQFLLQRVVSALIMRETDPAQTPLRRGIGAVFVGVMLAVIVAAGFGVYGLLTKVGTGTWKVDHAVVVERETGATFVYSAGPPPTLTPMLNYTSALLLSGQNPPAVFRVARRALTGIGRDIPRGIPGAPNELSDAKRVTGTPWILCAVPGRDLAGTPIVTTQLAVGRAPGGGSPLGDRALLVRDPHQPQTYLVWHSHRYLIAQPVLRALFGAQAQPLPVGTAWLNGLPVGADIVPIAIAGRGAPSPAVPGRRVGDLLFARLGSGGVQNYLVLADGLAPATALQKDILAAEAPVTPTEVPAWQVSSARISSRQLSPSAGQTQAPDAVPRLDISPSPDRALCAESDNASSPPRLVVDANPNLGPGAATGSQTTAGTTLADYIIVPAGQVAVVAAISSFGATMRTGLSIVSDTGVRFPVPSVQVLNTLGYSASAAVRMPASLVNRIPTGPTLAPEAAARAAIPSALGG
jgi:type VII secretion protein EccB